MIRQTINTTREATFSIDLPSDSAQGMAMPTGTGFFISPDGWFVTAAHVITNDKGEVRTDLDKAWLSKEHSPISLGGSCQFVEFKNLLPKFDFALLKVNFEKNSNKEWLKGKTGFPYIQVSTRQLDLGEPVYSFGYPLSPATATKINDNITISDSALSPRLTSAIIASQFDRTEMVMSSDDPKHYVLDKALNYGNSGGPIVATETGYVHALCSRFQPVFIPQNHLGNNRNVPHIMIPSLYGVVSSLNNDDIINLLTEYNILVIDK